MKFDWAAFFAYFTNLYLLEGAAWTLGLTIVTLFFGLLLGLMIATLRLTRSTASRIAAQGYVWIFRGTPLLVQLVIIYTGLPQFGIRLSVIQSALIGLALNEAAYLSEILRAGILAVPKSQAEAARSLGLSGLQTFWLVVMPQALRIIVPPLGNSVNGLLKTTSIASVISMEELMRRGQSLMQQRFDVLEVFLVVATIYLIMTTCWDFVQRRIEAYYARPNGPAGTGRLARDDH
jgi:polar amino acid transport system permease protein